ncbi:MAG TPA: hypothetical protein VF320_06350 [Acidimicrobiales bacterium]
MAAAVVAGIAHDRPMVPEGVEAWVGCFLHRVLPLRAADRLARASIGGV